MPEQDLGRERQRLAKVYAGMENEELEQIATDANSLTEAAFEALSSEMTRRGMSPPLRTATASTVNKTKPPVMVARFRDLPDAEVAKSMLDSAGIESFLAEENIVRLDWFYSNLVGGIKLLVREEDAEPAHELLKLNVPEKFDVEGIGEYQQPRCPNCHSLDVSFDELNKRFTFGAMWLFGLPVPIRRRRWECHSCGHEWQDNDTPQTGDSPEKSERE